MNNRIKQLLTNDKRWPGMYEGIFLEQGLVNYKDMKLGVGHLPKPTIDTMLNSFVGKPVVILHQDVDASNCNEHAVGYVTNSYFDPELGKYRVQFIITKDEAHDKIKNGYELSCAYTITDRGPGGKWHALNYDFEIKNGEFTHLALVPNPRYEDSTIAPMDIPMLINSVGEAVLKGEPLNQEESFMEFLGFKLWGKKDPKAATLENSFIEIDGKKVSMKELTQAHLKKLENAAAGEEFTDLNVDAEIEIKNAAGEPIKIKVADLVNSYKAINGKKVKNCGCSGVASGEPHLQNCKMYNADGTDKEKEKDDQEEDEKNQDKKEKAENARIEAKANEIINSRISEFKEQGKVKDMNMFTLLLNAKNTPIENSEMPTLVGNSLEDQIARGKELCGSKPAVK